MAYHNYLEKQTMFLASIYHNSLKTRNTVLASFLHNVGNGVLYLVHVCFVSCRYTITPPTRLCQPVNFVAGLATHQLCVILVTIFCHYANYHHSVLTKTRGKLYNVFNHGSKACMGICGRVDDESARQRKIHH
jgi:hypothetical protein